MINIALIGYGNMGKTIERISAESGEHRVVSISFKDHTRSLDIEGIKKADVAIDFTSPEIVMSTLQTLIPLRIPIVVGTTGWFEHLSKVNTLVKKHNGTLLYGGNFSIGANLFFQIVSYAATLFNTFPEYDVSGLEIHHTGKKDSPSGTARKLAEILMQNIPRKSELQTGRLDRQIKPTELHFASVRSGVNNGEHQITFDSSADSVILKHLAHNREGFAKGALVAASFLKDKKGIFRFEDMVIQRKEQT